MQAVQAEFREAFVGKLDLSFEDLIVKHCKKGIMAIEKVPEESKQVFKKAKLRVILAQIMQEEKRIKQ